eukprot:Opistho-1_new@47106
MPLRTQQWRARALVLLLAIFNAAGPMRGVSAGAGGPSVGGCGSALFLNSPFTWLYMTTTGTETTVTNFPSAAITIEYWTKYVNDFKFKSRPSYATVSYASGNVISQSGQAQAFDDNVIRPNM